MVHHRYHCSYTLYTYVRTKERLNLSIDICAYKVLRNIPTVYFKFSDKISKPVIGEYGSYL